MRDGSIIGTDKLQNMGNVYTFTDDIKGCLIVEKDNIVIDGAGYTLHGNSSSLKLPFLDNDKPIIGLDLSAIYPDAKDVTIQRLHIEDFDIAINFAVNATITNNYIEHNSYGICNIVDSTITNNHIAKNIYGISASGTGSHNNIIAENIITNNHYGIRFFLGPNHNFISRNKITENRVSGINFEYSNENFVLENEISSNLPRPENFLSVEIPDIPATNYTTLMPVGYGIFFSKSEDNHIIGNNITRNHVGLSFSVRSDSNVFYENKFYKQQQIYKQQIYPRNQTPPTDDSTTNIHESWDNGSRGNYWSDYNGTDTDGDGIGETPYIIDTNNQDNYPLILPDNYFQESINSHLTANAEFVGSQVKIEGAFMNDGMGVTFVPLLVSYSIDNGDSWHDLTSVTTDTNGNYSLTWLPSATGNYQVKITWEGNSTIPKTTTIVDVAVTAIQADELVSISSNSTITHFAFDTNREEISFSVSDPSNTTGYVRIYVTKTLFQDPKQVNVYLDGTLLTCTIESTDSTWILYFAYSHSSHGITINLSNTVNQFNHSLGWFATATIAAILAGGLICKKKLARLDKQ
jgi:parallel beta-helix repeat protein